MSGYDSDRVLRTARAAADSGAWGDVRTLLEQDVTGASTDGSRAILLAESCLRTGDPTTAAEWLDIATPILARAGDRPAQRRARNMQGAAAFARGALDTALDRFGMALEMARADDDSLMAARATNNLGAINALRGDAGRAITCYQRAIASYQRLGDARGLAESWHNMAISFRTRGELDAAEDAELRAIEFANEAGNPRLAAMAQVGRAEISLRRDDHAWARAAATRAAAVFESVPDYLSQADACRVAADACDRLGLTAEADDAITRAYSLAREHQHRLQEAQALQTHAQIMARRGNATTALAIGGDARALFSQIGSVAAAEEMAEWLASLSSGGRA